MDVLLSRSPHQGPGLAGHDGSLQAIDSFGNKYLLGVFETKGEAEKAFDEWNKEQLARESPLHFLSGNFLSPVSWEVQGMYM